MPLACKYISQDQFTPHQITPAVLYRPYALPRPIEENQMTNTSDPVKMGQENDQNNPLISFIIPTYNEAKNIKNTIARIKNNTPEECPYEIIIVDHGSDDTTREEARLCKAKTILHNQGTIAELRNIGAKHSKGKVLIFLDADILLTKEWKQAIPSVISRILAGDPIISGSWVSVPPSPSWIEKHWFAPLEKGGNSHINSAHLIISRKFFFELDGFDEKLETGEDYDISIRAKKAGIEISEEPHLKVVHEGFPKTIWKFISREYWHGKGDALSISTLLGSKIAIGSIAFILANITAIISLITKQHDLLITSILFISGIVCGSTILKYRNEPLTTKAIDCLLYYFYYWARGLSILSAQWGNSVKKRTR